MVTVQGGPINLAFEEVDIDSFTATYTITQEDFDSGILINQATVFATDPVSEIVVTDLSDNDSFDENDPTVVEFCLEDETFNAISLEKTGEWNDENGDLIAQVGETISYLFSATNTGESTLFNISLQDPLPGINIEGGPIEELLPGESDDTTFTGTYILTQVDIDNGEVVNQATVTGEDEDENEVSDDSDDPNNVDNVDNNGDGEPDDPTVVVLPGVLPGVFEVFNGITPNGDGLNDFLWIQGISAYPDNNLKIFNRWGILIFDTDGYEEDAGGNVFTGEADARLIIEEDKKVPTGTYFYVLTFPEDPDKNPGKTSYSGYLYLNR
jgi:gliding motility-associated-like protein